ncbi:MAG: hypothetical protein DMG68_05185 [Acidobacteria bacterium]|nr:MAG: hypothetical protein DMG68_05185 [Acidobacteriota bacterium]
MLGKIPTLVTVAVLVVIFGCLKRHARSARLQLWMAGWVLVFLHFMANLLEPSSGPVSPSLLAVDLAALQASAIAFLTSVSRVVEDAYKRSLLLLIAGVPTVTYAVLAAYDIHARWPFVVCLVACFGGASLFILYVYGRMTRYVLLMTALCTVAAFWTVRAALHGSVDEGLTAFLGLGFGYAEITGGHPPAS